MGCYISGYSDKELICVNLDNTAEEAKDFVKRASAVGTHIHQPGGLDSKLATEYGVMVLPNMFLVGKENQNVRGIPYNSQYHVDGLTIQLVLNPQRFDVIDQNM